MSSTSISRNAQNTRPIKSFVYVVFAVLTLGLATSCSIIGLAYNNAPMLAVSEFDDAFDLDDSQRGALEARMEQFFDWHRNEELPLYRALLERAAGSAAGGISSEAFVEFSEDVRAAWRRSAARFIDLSADLAITLTPAQIDRFERYFAEKSERHEDYLAKSRQQREIHRAEHNLERLEFWFGRFDEYTEERALARLQELPDNYGPWIAYRQARFGALIEALRGARDADSLRRQLLTALFDPSTEYARAFESSRDAYWRAYARALVDISGWVTGAQRQRAIARLRSYADVADRLSRES